MTQPQTEPTEIYQQLEIDFLPLANDDDDDDDEPICLIDGSGHCSSCEE